MSSQDDQNSAQVVIPDTVDSTTATTQQSLARAVYARRSEYVRPHRIKVKIGTWNVAACPGTDKDLATWFTDGEGIDCDLATLNVSQNAPVAHVNESQNHDGSGSHRLLSEKNIGLYVLGLQEIVDLNAFVNRAVYTDTTTTAKWQAALEAALPAGYELITSEQMTGLLLLVYASPEVAATISNVSTKQVGTGLLGYFGNKGAVSTRLLLGETTRMVFVNSHLASGAGASNLDRRCWDVGQILSKTQFDPIVIAGSEDDEGEKIGDEDLAFWLGDLNFRLDGLPGDDIRRLLMLHARGEYGASEKPLEPTIDDLGIIVMKGDDSEDDAITPRTSLHSRQVSVESAITLPDPDDFPEDPSQDPTSLQATIDSLLPHDQLRRMIKERKVFHDGWQEGSITFLPTYKYDVGTVGLFDTSEKQRAPSWCDRILFRTRKDKLEYEEKVKEEEESRKKDEEMRARGLEEDDDVLFSYDPDTDGDANDAVVYDEYDENEDPEAEDIITKEGFHDRIDLEIYASHQHITSSDHKPISSLFTLDYDAVVPELKAKIHAEVARELDRAENEGRPGITVIVEGGSGKEKIVDFGLVGPLERRTCSLTVANTGSVAATFSFVEKPTTENGDEPIPDWLKTTFVRADEDSPEPLGQAVTLDPGETATVLLEIRVSSISQIRALNGGQARIEDVLVLRIEDGRDHFVPIRGIWKPTCLGRSISELIRIPDGGIRRFMEEKQIHGTIPEDAPVQCSAPREIFKITEAAQTLVERSIADATMLEDAALPRDIGWPVEPATWRVEQDELLRYQVDLLNALDTDSPLIESMPIELAASRKIEVLCSIMLMFIESLTDGIIPAHILTRICVVLPNITSTPLGSWPDAKTQILDVLSSAPNHNIAFVFLTAMLSRIAFELTPATSDQKTIGLSRRLSFRIGGEAEDTKKRKLRERTYAEVVGPLVCRAYENEKGAKDKTRTVVEMFLRKDD